MAKSSADSDAFRATVLDHIRAELAAAEEVERADLLAKAEHLLETELAEAGIEPEPAATEPSRAD